MLGNEYVVAFGDKAVSFYSLKKVDEPSRLDEDKNFENGIKLIFYNDAYVGVIEAGSQEKDPGILHVYEVSGKEALSLELTETYEKGTFAGDEILLYNSGACELITMGGHTKFKGTIDGGIDFMAKGEKRNQLLVVGGGKISACTLK